MCVGGGCRLVGAAPLALAQTTPRRPGAPRPWRGICLAAGPQVRVKINDLAESWTPQQKEHCLEVGAALLPAAALAARGGRRRRSRPRLALAAAPSPALHCARARAANPHPLARNQPQETAATFKNSGGLMRFIAGSP